jgi:hypothetical protein
LKFTAPKRKVGEYKLGLVPQHTLFNLEDRVRIVEDEGLVVLSTAIEHCKEILSALKASEKVVIQFDAIFGDGLPEADQVVDVAPARDIERHDVLAREDHRDAPVAAIHKKFSKKVRAGGVALVHDIIQHNHQPRVNVYGTTPGLAFGGPDTRDDTALGVHNGSQLLHIQAVMDVRLGDKAIVKGVALLCARKDDASWEAKEVEAVDNVLDEGRLSRVFMADNHHVEAFVPEMNHGLEAFQRQCRHDPCPRINSWIQWPRSDRPSRPRPWDNQPP